VLGARLEDAEDEGALRISVPRDDSRGMPVDARGGLAGFAPTPRFGCVTLRLGAVACGRPPPLLR
jgi:hypothetical protein